MIDGHEREPAEAGGSGPAVKTFEDAQITITPNATNEVGQPHTFTVTVMQDDGLTAAQGGDGVTGFTPVGAGKAVTVTLTDKNGAVDVPSTPLTGTTDANGQFKLTFTSASAGQVVGNATTTFALNGVTHLATRAWIDSTGGDSGTVKYVELSPSLMPAALDAGRIDAAYDGEPYLDIAKKTDRVLFYGNDAIAKHYLSSVWCAAAGWVKEHPDYYIEGTELQLAQQPQNYTRIPGGPILAYGRDPYFAGWPDTLQLNYANPSLQQAMMGELGKVKRVVSKRAAVDEVLLVLDATIGQNGLAQARVFADVVDITGVALTKLDGTAKGGIVFRVQQELGVPVKLVGLGEGPDDLAPFEPEAFVDALLG